MSQRFYGLKFRRADMHQLLSFRIRQLIFGFLFRLYLAKTVGNFFHILNRFFGVNAAINQDLRCLTSNATSTNTDIPGKRLLKQFRGAPGAFQALRGDT
ncbi:hypothetical protein NGUA11_04023 [Salmonella enterica]|nr:hypothetical protein NGUA11_04023 [Salmonella enterica]